MSKLEKRDGRWMHVECEFDPTDGPNFTFPFNSESQYCKHCMSVFREENGKRVSISPLSPALRNVEE